MISRTFVLAVVAALLVSLVPTYSLEIAEPLVTHTSPVSLQFTISLDGTAVEELFGSEVTIDFITKDNRLMKVSVTTLDGTEGVYSTVADVPFAGTYKADIYAETEQNATVSNGSTDFYFYVAETPSYTTADITLFKKILRPGESFGVEADIRFMNGPLGNLSVSAVVDDVTYPMTWNSTSVVYEATLDAPATDNMYDVIVFSEDDPNVRDKGRIYVIKPEGNATQCPQDLACNTPEQQRACMVAFKDNIITESDIMMCAQSLYSGAIYNAYCNKDFKGDFDADAVFYDANDVIVMDQLLQRPEDQRSDFLQCADYNADGVVDILDQECMENVKIGHWFPNFCVDVDAVAVSECVLKGDLNTDLKIDGIDVTKMEQLIMQLNRNPELEVPEELLDCVDFDQDGAVDDDDLSCMGHFTLLDMSHATTDLSKSRPLAASRTIPEQCMEIYHLDQCHDIQGDLNGDNTMDLVDNMLIILLVDGVIDHKDYDNLIDCADVNEDKLVSRDDEICIEAMLQGKTDYYRKCLGCDENIGEWYSPLEICNDGYDNNCDGLIDKTSLDPQEDQCSCGPETICSLPKDTYSASPGVSDLKAQFCMARSSESSTLDLYRWQAAPKCSEATHCEKFECGAENNDDGYAGTYKCYAYKYRKLSSPGWLRSSPGGESDDIKKGECENGIDEDCDGHDEECDRSAQETWKRVQLAITIAMLIFAAYAVSSPAAGTATNAAGTAGKTTSWWTRGLAQKGIFSNVVGWEAVVGAAGIGAILWAGKEAKDAGKKGHSKTSLKNTGYSEPHAEGFSSS